MASHLKEQFEFVCVGDTEITRPILPYRGNSENFDQLHSIISDADASIANLEMIIHNYQEGVYPFPGSGSSTTPMRAPPRVLEDLKGYGFDMLAAANNHSMDYDRGGLESTLNELNNHDIPFAGLGSNLFEARKPAYLETGSGRVGLVAATSTYSSGSAALEQTPASSGTPGVNPLPVDQIYKLSEDNLEELQNIGKALRFDEIKEHWLTRGKFSGRKWRDERYYHFMNMQFQQVNSEEEEGIYHSTNADEAEKILEWIEEADAKANWVIMSLHTHQSPLLWKGRSITPDFLVDFARSCIDAGADAFMAHGPHVLRGIEIYEGAPIFYSLGNFMDQRELITKLAAFNYDRFDMPDRTKVSKVFEARNYDEDGNPRGDLANEERWKTIVPRCIFKDSTIDRIEIYPVSLQLDAGSAQRGVPVIATGDLADTILQEITALSAEFGTDIIRKDGKAEIRL